MKNGRSRAYTMVLALLLLSSCAKPPQPKPEPPLDVIPGGERGQDKPAVSEAERDYVVVTVHYGTDRKATGQAEPNRFYGTGRGELQFGQVDVSIPKRHKAGNVESPSWMRLEFKEDPNKHIMLLELKPLSRDAFRDSVRREMKEGPGRGDLFVYIHGFKNDFRSSVRRTAQLAYELGFAGLLK